MERTHKYIAGMVIAAAAIVCGGLSFLRGAVKTYSQADPDISYSMPRPTRGPLYTLLFGLEGRELQYKEVNPFKDKKTKAATSAANKSVRGDQKNAPKINANKQANAKASTPIPAPHKPQVEVNVVNANANPTTNGNKDTSTISTTGGGAAQIVNTVVVPLDGKKAKEDTLSPGQWRALIIGQPTKENINKLVDAFNNKEVDANTLYLIMNDLLQSSNSETQVAGLWLAQSVPSLKSFSTLSDNYDKLNPANKASADTYFLTYMQTSRLPILAMALKSSDVVTVQRAVHVMATGLQQVKNDPNSRENRPARGVVGTGGTNAYTQFIPILQQLIQSADSSVSGPAQSALTQIQRMSNV